MDVATWHGLKCPQCGQDDALKVKVSTWCAMLTDGTEDVGDHEWDADSDCLCDCGHEGKAAAFSVQHQTAKPKQLPPDPEGQNFNRAAWADVGLRAFQEETKTDDEDLLSDLLCDLMHWADRSGEDFEGRLERARRAYREETCSVGTLYANAMEGRNG